MLTTTISPARASEELDRDVELMGALRIIAAQEARWTAQDWGVLGWNTAKYVVAPIVLIGGGVTFYYVLAPRGFSPGKLHIAQHAKAAKDYFLAHGGASLRNLIVGASVAAAPVLIPAVINQVLAVNRLSEAERLRTAATPDARVYRSQLRQFFRLSLSEQFLIARQDAVLTADLLRLARWIESQNAAGQSPDRVSPVEIPAPPGT